MSRHAPAGAPGPGQLDLLAAPGAGRHNAPALCLFNSVARGLPARTAELDAWKAVHGNPGCLIRSHAWHVASTCPAEPTTRCRPTVLAVDVRPPFRGLDPDCGCVRFGELLRRGACTGCVWEGRVGGAANAAAEDACDHAWPGWRDLPIVPAAPSTGEVHGAKDRAARTRWTGQVNAVYPAGWLEAGGPVRTARNAGAARHHGGGTPFGGWDLGVVVEG